MDLVFGSDFDLLIDVNDLATDNTLRTAVLISLFTDKRARVDDDIPDGSRNRRGYWGDSFADVEGDEIGSHLWLLLRSKQTSETLNRAQEYAVKALQWLIDDGVAVSVSADTSWLRPGVLLFEVSISLPDGSRFDDVFNYDLEAA